MAKVFIAVVCLFKRYRQTGRQILEESDCGSREKKSKKEFLLKPSEFGGKFIRRESGYVLPFLYS